MLCREPDASPWALVVFIPIVRTLHAVLLPLFEEPWAVKWYLEFLRNDVEQLSVAAVRFQDQSWHMSRETRTIRWPKPARLFGSEAEPVWDEN